MLKEKPSANYFWLFAITLLLFFVNSDAHARKNGFGLGVIIGEPTGPTFKVWTSATNAIDGALAWSFDGNDDLHLHADYLFHEFGAIQVDKGRMPLYYGIGGRIRFHDGNQDDEIGVRIPAGIAYLFANSPVEIFLEVVPIVDLAPDTDLDFNGGIGIRYYIGK